MKMFLISKRNKHLSTGTCFCKSFKRRSKFSGKWLKFLTSLMERRYLPLKSQRKKEVCFVSHVTFYRSFIVNAPVLKHASSSFLTPKTKRLNYQNRLKGVYVQGCYQLCLMGKHTQVHVQIQSVDQSFVQPLYLLKDSAFKRLHLHLLLSQARIQSDTLGVGLGANLSDLLVSSVGEQEKKPTDSK